MKGSPLSVGTDIGGSALLSSVIRGAYLHHVHRSLCIPSTFCGLYMLCPSHVRLLYSGAMNALEGQESISSVLGPMANSLLGVKIFTKVVLDAQPRLKDPVVLRKGWMEDEYCLVQGFVSLNGGCSLMCKRRPDYLL
jgi:amidase